MSAALRANTAAPPLPPAPPPFAAAAAEPAGNPVSLGEQASAPSPPSAGPSRLEQLGRLTAGVAHDFNNLLSVIMVCADEIAEGAGREIQRGRADEIRAAAERGAALSRRLLRAERIEEPASETIAVDAAIRDGLGLLARTLGDEIELEVACDQHLPDVRLTSAELERILINLAANSRDAMPHGGSVAIRTDLTMVGRGDPCLGTGWYVRISFADTGSGMPPDVARHAIRPYFSTKSELHGTGLGLATVHGLVRAAGGAVRFDTAPGSGTTVSIYLPAVGADGSPLTLAA